MSKKVHVTPEMTYQDGSLFHDAKGRPVPTPAPLAPLADSHGHLTHFRMHDPAGALGRAAAAGVRLLVVPLDPTEDARDAQRILDDLSRWEEEGLAELARLRDCGAVVEHPWPDGAGGSRSDGYLDLRIVAGAHPYGAKRLDGEALVALELLLADARCVGVGEIGLDVGPWNELPLADQEQAFRLQLRIAHDHSLPVELHLRDEGDGRTTAHDRALAILREEGVPQAGCDLHCFTSGPEVMAPFVELGCHLAFGGAATFPRSQEIRAAAVSCPSELLLCETDSPYMAPVPLRGQECEPAMVSLSAALVASVRAEQGRATPEETYMTLWNNARTFFGLA